MLVAGKVVTCLLVIFNFDSTLSQYLQFYDQKLTRDPWIDVVEIGMYVKGRNSPMKASFAGPVEHEILCSFKCSWDEKCHAFQVEKYVLSLCLFACYKTPYCSDLMQKSSVMSFVPRSFGEKIWPGVKVPDCSSRVTIWQIKKGTRRARQPLHTSMRTRYLLRAIWLTKVRLSWLLWKFLS